MAEHAQVPHLSVSVNKGARGTVERNRITDDLTVRIDIEALAGDGFVQRSEIHDRVERHCAGGRAKQEHRSELQALSNGSSFHDPLPWAADLPLLRRAPGRPVGAGPACYWRDDSAMHAKASRTYSRGEVTHASATQKTRRPSSTRIPIVRWSVENDARRSPIVRG